MGYVGNIPAEKYASFEVQHFTTSATTSYTLTHAVANELDIRLVLNNVIQQPGASYAYTASATTLTLSSATAGTDTMYAVYIGKAVQTVNPGADSVGTSQLATDAVTTVKILDTAVTGAKLNDDAISGQGALGAEPADTDEFLVSDAGVLKRVDYSYIKASPTDEFRPNANPLIINGNCAIAQRGSSAAGKNSSGYYTVDRINIGFAMGTWDQTQESLTSGNAYTDGFSNALKMDCTIADTSVASSDRLALSYSIEGQDLQLLKKGTANAEKITISFWVKATKTGTNILELYDNDNNRQISIAYTISITNTWEYKVVNFSADTTGVFGDDNGASLTINWWMGAGSNFSSGTLSTSWSSVTDADRAVGQVNHADSTSNNFHLTGIQLEVGEYTSSTIPPFQHESFANNLARCQRYYYKTSGVANMPFASGVCNGTTNARGYITYPQIMRASPTMGRSGATSFKVYCGSTNVDTTVCSFYYGNTQQVLIYVDVSSGLTNGQGCLIIDDSGAISYITGDSEL